VIKDEKLAENAEKMGQLTRKNLEVFLFLYFFFFFFFFFPAALAASLAPPFGFA